MRKATRRATLAASKGRYALMAAAAAALASAGAADGALVLNWIGDNYVGGNWVDSVSGVVATAVGSPSAFGGAFGSHAGVNFDGSSNFTVPAGNTPSTSSSFTIGVAFRSPGPGPSGAAWWQSAGLVGSEQGGVVNDWGLGWGENGGSPVVRGGIGAPAPGAGGDRTLTSPNSTVDDTHSAVLQVNAASGVMRLYVDGVQVAQDTAIGAIANRNSAVYALGAMTSAGGNRFFGQIAEIQIYNDATVNGLNLSQSLFNTYALGFTGNNVWTGATGNFGDATWSLGHSPTATEGAVLANGGTINTTAAHTVLTGQVASGTLNVNGGGDLTVTTALDFGPGTNAGAATINLNAGGKLTVGTMTVDNGATNGAGAKAIHFDGGTLAATNSFTLTGANLTTTVGASGATVDVQSGATVTWAPALTPTAAGAALTKLGAGTLNLTGGGYARQVSVLAGSLGVAGDVGIGASTLQLGDAAVTGGDVATLRLSAPGTILSPVAVGTPAGAGTYTINVSTNATVAIPNAITMNQPLTISTVATPGTNALIISGGISSTLGGNTLTIANAGTVNVATAGINDGSGTLALVKNAAGRLNLLAANNYTGGTTVNGGVVLFDAPNTIGGTGANVLVNAAGVAAAGTNFVYTNLNGTFLNRIDTNSQGAVALAANSAENFDFAALGFNGAFLGAVTNVTYTGALTPAGGAYRVGGGGGNLTFANANAITGGNALIVGGAAGGTVTLAQANNYTGETTILTGGTLAVANGDRLSAANINLDGGTIGVIGTAPAVLPQLITLSANGGGLRVDNPSATFTGGFQNNGLVAASRFIKTGTGTANIGTVLDLGPAVPLFREGTVAFSGTGALNTTSFFSVGETTGNNATAIFQGSATASVATDFNVSDVQNSIGKMFVRDSASIATRTLYVGKNGTSEGSLLQSGGTISNGGFTATDWRIGGGGGAGDLNAVGSYTVTGGSMATTGNFQIGANGRGVMTMTGGSAAVGGTPAVGRFATSYGVLTVAGGSFNTTNTAGLTIVAEAGIGHMNVMSGGTVNAAGNLRIGHAAGGVGYVNVLPGGTINARAISGNVGTGTLNLNGGTIKPTGSAAAFIGSLANVYVHAGGGTIDTTAGNVTILSPLKAPTGSGLASVQLTGGGANYVSHPLVEVTGGGGTGASAIAILNGSGQVTGVQVTNPGVGYTSPPTLTLKGGGSTTPATLGAIGLAGNTGGAFTKTGPGTLTIGSVDNTHSGPTVINQGTLKLSAAPGASAAAIWNADTVVGNQGDPVATWTDTVAGRQATQNGARAVPTLALNSIGTRSALRFAGGTNETSLQVLDNPVANATDFSVALVFKTSTPGVGGDAQWYNNTGLVDNEQGGAQLDWGIALNSIGKIAAGIGNADITRYSQGGLANGVGHVAIMSRSGEGPYSITVDGQTVGAIAPTAPRNAVRLLFGGLQTNLNFFTGDIAQVQMYNAALTPSQVNALGSSLSSYYGLTNTFLGALGLPNSDVTVNAGGTLDADGGQRIKSLSVGAGGTAVVSSGALSIGNNAVATPLAIAAGGRVNLAANGVILDVAPGGEAAALAAVRGQIISGFAGGTWNGNGMTSSFAAANASARGVGYALASEILGPGGGTFLGSAADGSAVLARYTLLGDADLSGLVDFNDLVRLAQNYNNLSGSAVWYQADFTYDGNVDFNDLVKLAQNYNQGLPAGPIAGAPAGFEADLAAAFAIVPEPGAVGLVGIFACGLAGRRKRRAR